MMGRCWDGPTVSTVTSPRLLTGHESGKPLPPGKRRAGSAGVTGVSQSRHQPTTYKVIVKTELPPVPKCLSSWQIHSLFPRTHLTWPSPLTTHPMSPAMNFLIPQIPVQCLPLTRLPPNCSTSLSEFTPSQSRWRIKLMDSTMLLWFLCKRAHVKTLTSQGNPLWSPGRGGVQAGWSHPVFSLQLFYNKIYTGTTVH